MNGEPNCKRLFSLDDLGVMQEAWLLHFYLLEGLKFVAFVVESKRQAGRYKLLRNTLLRDFASSRLGNSSVLFNAYSLVLLLCNFYVEHCMY